LADRRRSYRILIVDDDSPEIAIKRHLASLARTEGVTILSNPINLGFVGSVNRALSQLDGGDVVLLNADTIVPTGFVERLKATAALSADIGTVVPLSNNSEITDFPNPHGSNPLGSRDEVLWLDGVAAESNAAAAVEIPNGTGFCLYITRACLNAVGHLSENFQRGYLEDIDLCLRARERGFRNVCAARFMSVTPARVRSGAKSGRWCCTISTFWITDFLVFETSVQLLSRPIHFVPAVNKSNES
jgi:GT2 family glycosyltransferase